MYCYSCYRLHGGNTVRSDHRVVSRPRARFASGLFTSHPTTSRAPTQQLCGTVRVSFLAPFASGTTAAGSPSSTAWGSAEPLRPAGPFFFFANPWIFRCRAAAKRYALGESFGSTGCRKWRRATHTEAICGPRLRKEASDGESDDDEIGEAGTAAKAGTEARRTVNRPAQRGEVFGASLPKSEPTQRLDEAARSSASRRRAAAGKFRLASGKPPGSDETAPAPTGRPVPRVLSDPGGAEGLQRLLSSPSCRRPHMSRCPARMRQSSRASPLLIDVHLRGLPCSARQAVADRIAHGRQSRTQSWPRA